MIQFFCSRGAMNIEGIGEVLAQELVRKGLVGDPADIFDLTVERLAPDKKAPADTVRVERMARKSAENLVASHPEGARDRHPVAPADRAGHPPRRGGGGAGGGPALPHLRRPVRRRVQRPPGGVASIDGVGPVIGDAIEAWFAQPQNAELVRKLRARGVSPEEPEERARQRPPGRQAPVRDRQARPPAQ